MSKNTDIPTPPPELWETHAFLINWSSYNWFTRKSKDDMLPCIYDDSQSLIRNQEVRISKKS